MKNNKGFTLMEVLVVIFIIAILVAILIPQLPDFTHAANEAVDKTKLHNLNLATSIYRSEQGTEGTDIFSGIDSDLLRMNKLVDEGYLDEILIPNLIEHEFIWNIGEQLWEIEINE
jgi:prepilin-type N-terminal cleavage/methylation domain-containing protein